MEYQDFEIEITRTGDGVHQVNVIRTPAGEIRQPFTFGLNDASLRESLAQIEKTLRYTEAGLTFAEKRAMVADMKAFGGRLFEVLINDNLKSLYDQSRYLAKDQEQGLRLKLRIDDPLLAAVPWELLYDPRLDEFLSTSRQVSIVRYVPLPRAVQLLATKPPLHVLGIVSSPTNLHPLDITREKQQVEMALKPLVDQGLASLTWLPKANWRTLMRAMHQGPWHVLHYIGHSDFDVEADEGYLSLENEEGKEYRLSANNLGTLLADHGSLRLVLLNSCRGAHIGQDIYSGVAVKLVQRGIPAVIGMQYDISERAALEFARTFYETLAENRPIETALAEARKAISIALDESAEWGTPVFYTHAPDSLLFDVPRTLEPESVDADVWVASAWQRVEKDVEQWLQATVPNPEQAEQLLTAAQEDSLILPGDKRFEQLQALLPGKRALVAAIKLLEDDPTEKNIDEAISFLKKAVDELPLSESATITPWQQFAQAWRAYQRHNFKQADDLIREIDTPVAERLAVKTLQQKIILALEDQTHLYHFEETVKQLLRQDPPDYQQAVKSVHEARGGLRDKALVGPLLQRVQERLFAATKAYRDKNDYATAIAYGELLLELPPDNSDVAEFAHNLKPEREKRLNDILAMGGEADKAKRAVSLYDLEKALVVAKQIAGAAGDSRILQKEEDLRKLRSDITVADNLIKSAQEAQKRGAWAEAIQHIQEANNTLPAYQPVIEQQESLKQQLLSEVAALLQAESFVRVIELGQLGASIQNSAEFTELVEQARQRREAIWQELRERANKALTAWNLDVAGEAIQKGLSLAPRDDPDAKLASYQEAYLNKKRQAPDLARLMEDGWRALRERDYSEAKRLFAEVLNKAPDFAEAGAWRQFAVNMENGVQAVEESKFKQGVRIFEDAESWLRLVEGAYLPSIISNENHLRQMRRQAVYDAYRLRNKAQKMAGMKEGAEDAYNRNNPSRSWELINAYKQEQQAFTSLHSTLTSPPADFDASFVFSHVK